MLVPELVSAFVAWNERHRSESAVKLYGGRLKRFAVEFAGRDWDSLTPLQLDEFFFKAATSTKGRALSESTKCHNITAVEALQKFAVANRLGKRIVDKLEKPRIGRREQLATDAEVRALLKDAPAAFRLLFVTLSQTGCRPNELCRLQISDVMKRPGKFVDVIELAKHKTARKTGRPRLIPIGKKFARLLWLAIGDRPEGPVFLNCRGQAWNPDAFAKANRRLREAAGLGPHVIPYGCRHSFATLQLERGADIKTVADLLGHSSVKTTERYLHRDIKTLRGEQDGI